MKQDLFYGERALLIDNPDRSGDEYRFVLLGVAYSLRLVLVCHCHRDEGSVIRLSLHVKQQLMKQEIIRSDVCVKNTISGAKKPVCFSIKEAQHHLFG